jgi:ABC-type polysaccharide/polyol phosphate transport system ATPase subunit
MDNRTDSSPAIRVDDVSVYYKLAYNRPTSLKEYTIRRVAGDLSSGVVKALEGVSFEIHSGDVFGIIGRNGAGKSTLLKTISGILTPTRGRVRVWGNIASLLGIGAGFHPELTGRENIYLYSAILGRSQRLTESLVDGVIKFAELADFIDSPLRVYSSGMAARLGFAVAMADRPKILLIDEVLGVGDEQFRKKCQSRFTDFRESGTTIVIVTHSMDVITSMCNGAIWLDNGRVASIGDGEQVVADYRSSFNYSIR